MTAEAGGDRRIQRIGIFARPRHEALPALLDRLVVFATDHGLDLFVEEWAQEQVSPPLQLLDLANNPVDLILTLGGDGTLLRGARQTGMGTPILGVNLGHLGFLTSIASEELEPRLQEVLAGDYVLDRRFTLKVEVTDPEGEVREEFLALNDVVVHKHGAARVTRLDLRIRWDGHEEEVGSFTGDGVILSTPTGSTAYSMSAGGPIVVPDVECITVTPICPHTLSMRPMVVPASEAIVVQGLGPAEELAVSVDGDFATELMSGETVTVRQSEISISLVRFPHQSFFSTLKRKLNWAAHPQP